MNKKECRLQMQSRLDQGESHSAIYDAYKNSGLKEKELALMVASLKDRTLCALQERKNNVLITLMFIQALIGALAAFQLAEAAQLSPQVFALIGGGVPLLFAFGFYRYAAVAYQVFIILGLIRIPSVVIGLMTGSPEAALDAVITLALLAFVWHLKNQIFPFLGLIRAKQTGGRYLFEDEQYQSVI